MPDRRPIPGPRDNAWLWSAAKLLALVSVFVVGLLLLWLLSDVLLLVFAAVLLALLFRAAAAPIERFTPVSERASVLLAVLLVAAIVVGLGWLLGTRLWTQLVVLIETLPDLVAQVENRFGIDGLGDWLERQRLAIFDNGSLVVNVASYSTTVIEVGAQVLIVLGASIYLALSPRSYVEGMLSVLPEPQAAKARDTLWTMGRALRLWLLGQLAAMLLIGVLTSLGLWLLGVPSALALGVIAGLLEFVPYVGPTLSAVPALVVALAQSPTLALWVLLLYVVIQQAEGILVTPLVQQYTVDLPPVLTIFALLVFGTLFGPMGLLLGTPLAVVAMVAVKKLWVRDVLQEEVSIPGEDLGEEADTDKPAG